MAEVGVGEALSFEIGMNDLMMAKMLALLELHLVLYLHFNYAAEV